MTSKIENKTLPFDIYSREPSYSKKIYAISKQYQKRILDPDATLPFEKDAFPKLPSATNLLSLPMDTYSAAKSLLYSIEIRDKEEVKDATLSLLSAPANLGNSLGILLEYALEFKLASTSFSPFLKFSYFFGMAFCLLEGLADVFGLNRQLSFSRKFDLNLLKNLSQLINNPDIFKGYESFKNVETTFKKTRSKLENLFGKETTQALFDFLSDLKNQMHEHPHFRTLILEDAKNELKALTRTFLINTLFEQHKSFFQISAKKAEELTNWVKKRYKGETPEVQQVKLEKALDMELNCRQKKLARRVRPWLAYEAHFKIQSLLERLSNKDPTVSDQALNEGLSLMNEMRIQNQKKIIVHSVGIIVFLITAVSLLTLALGCPFLIPISLVGVATAIATGRFLIAAGTLDVRGWGFSSKDLIPNWIREKIFEDLPLSHPEMLRKKTIAPLPSALPA